MYSRDVQSKMPQGLQGFTVYSRDVRSKMSQGLQGFTVYSRDVQQFQDAAGVYKY